MLAWKKNKKILVRQEDVRKISFELIAEGVQHRKRKKLVRQKYRNPGLSYVWHIDGHDKLKPFDFSVFKCIDGFSRKRNWLEVTSSNKVPEIISQCYLKAIERLKGAPNNECRSWYWPLSTIHIYLRSLNNDTGDVLNSFSIVPFTVNQRIESYWSKFIVDRPV